MHTPGPWRISKESPTIIKRDFREIGSDEGELIASAHGYSNSGFFPDGAAAIANARLIAAAPELLAALRNYVDGCSLSIDALAVARAAIAKATGGAL